MPKDNDLRVAVIELEIAQIKETRAKVLAEHEEEMARLDAQIRERESLAKELA